jgi:hypothetical protein
VASTPPLEPNQTVGQANFCFPCNATGIVPERDLVLV